MPWNGSQSPFGFTSGKPWLPIPQSWRDLSVAAQESDRASTLNLYRNALKIRKEKLVGAGDIEWVDRGETGLISFARGEFAIYLNTGALDLQIPSVGALALGSNASVSLQNGTLTLPAATTAWVATR
jgi:alpha-glucosidase